MGNVALHIDGRKPKAREGVTVLGEAEANGITIPALCHIKELLPTGVAAYAWWRRQGEDADWGLPHACIQGDGGALWVLISNKIGKKLAYILGLSIYGLSFGALYFINSTDIVTLIPLFVLFAIGFTGVGLEMGSLMPDTVEYGEWKLGVRNEGLQYGLYTFMLKLATSIAAITVGLGLDMSGYVANVVQTEGSLMGIRMLTSIVPLVAAAIGVIILLFYPINEKMHGQMIKVIEARKGTSQP